MMISQQKQLLAVAACLLASATQSQAALFFSFGDSAQSSFNLPVNSSVSIPLYLEETDTTILIDGQGLYSAAAIITSQNPNNAYISDFEFNTAGGFAPLYSSIDPMTNDTEFYEFIDFVPDPTDSSLLILPPGPGVGAGSSRILLGNIIINTGPDADQTIQITASVRDDTYQDIDTWNDFSINGYPLNTLDASIESATLSINTIPASVPEPASLALLALGALGLLARKHNSR